MLLRGLKQMSTALRHGLLPAEEGEKKASNMHQSLKRLWTRQKSQKREKVHQTKKGRRKKQLDVLWPRRFRGGATHTELWGT